MMRCPTLAELPPPPAGRHGWPWTEAPPPLPEHRADGAAWPRVSIVVPSFRQAAFLEETLRSVLLQGYPRLELLVIDGGSDDGSVEILRRYERWLACWVSEPDGGQSDAINKGFARASGELLTFLSSDDVYFPGTLADLAERWLARPDCGAVVGAFRFLDAASRPEPEVHPPRLPHEGPLDLALTPPASWRLHQVATFYSRHALDAAGRHVRTQLVYTMDRELLQRVCRRFPVVLSERVYAGFRRHPGSKSEAHLLPFSREMAQLHLLDAPAGEAPRLCRLRRRLAAYRRARGYLKLAAATRSRGRAALALLAALRYTPGLILQRAYAVRWLRLLGFSRAPHRPPVS